MHQLTLQQFRTSAETGAVLSVTLRADGAKFVLNAETRGGDATLVTGRTKTQRAFANPAQALTVLRGLGITDLRVDTSDWRPEDAAATRRTRPDRAEALRASHDAYVRMKLERALSAPQRSVSHSAAMKRADKIIAATEKRNAR